MLTRHRLAKLSVLLSMLLTPCLQAQTLPISRPLIAFNIPPGGALAATVDAACQTLRTGGLCDVWSLTQADALRNGQSLSGLVFDGSTPLPRGLTDLSEYLSSGGGLVLVLPTTPHWVSTHPELAAMLDLQVVSVANQGPQLAMRSHPVTAGLTEGPMNPVGSRLQSTVLEPLVSQGGHAIALAGVVGSGRVVVLPEQLVASLDLGRAPDADRVKLLSQAAQWVAERAELSIAVEGPADTDTPSTQVARVALGARIVTDIPNDAAWQDAAATVADAAQRLGLPVDRLSPRPGASALADAMAGYPVVIVLASYREFDDRERALAVQYVADGGALLALGSCRDGDTGKLAAFNRLLAEFGISMTWARPGGVVKTRKHAVTRGLPAEVTAPPGSAVWAFSDRPLVVGSQGDVATALQVDRGRIVVMDAATLVPDKSVPAASTQAFGQLVVGAMRWLAGK